MKGSPFSFSAKENFLDIGIKSFISRYRIELVASLSFVMLIGAVVLGKAIIRQRSIEQLSFQSDKIEVVDEQTQVESAIWVDVAGAVVKPGVYELAIGSRVVDALNSAGGFSEEANLQQVAQTINQAEVLVDGLKIYVPFRIEQNTTNESSVDTPITTTISLNYSTIDQLMELPGIGNTYAQNIINARPFQRVEDLKNVSGIGDRRYLQIKDLVRVN